MHCPTCGQDLPEQAATCPHCGWTNEVSTQQPMPSPWAQPDTPGTVPPGAPPVPATAGYGGPQEYRATHVPSPAIGPDFVIPPPPRKRRRLVGALIVALSILLVGGGGVAVAGGYLGWYGGGKHPYDVMPAATAAYLQLDLNPSVAQKLSTWQFFSDVPDVRDALAQGQPDPKRMLWKWLVSNWAVATDSNYDRDVKPWLGDRVGFGVMRNGDRTAWMTAIQVTDEAKGVAQLRAWIAASQQAYDVTARDGYALITMTPDTSSVLVELERASLGEGGTFASDLASLGDPGVMAGWSDLGTAPRAFSPGGGDQDLQGRVAFALRFTADTMSLDGLVIGSNVANGTGSIGAGELGNLPATTGAAIGVSGGAATLKLTWPHLGSEAGSWAEQAGLEQADVEALLGRQLSVGIPAAVLSGSSGDPAFGLRVVSDDVLRAQRSLRAVSSSFFQADVVVDAVDGEVLTAATTRGYFEELTRAGSAKLSGSEVFTKAVPDHATATSAFFLDLRLAVRDGADMPQEYRPFFTALRGLGGEYLDEGSGDASWSVRVVRA